MTTQKRRKHSAADKARIAMEAIIGQLTASEIAAKYGVHPVQVSQWKKELVARAPELFERKGGRPERDAEEIEKENHAKIGQLTLEVDWLKKKCKQLQIPIDGGR
jgi:transposase-like protein